MVKSDASMLRHKRFIARLWAVTACALMCQALYADDKAVSPDWEGTWASSPATLDAQLAACCIGPGTIVPLTAKYRALRDAFVGRRGEAQRATVGNSASCTPPGMPGLMMHPILFEILFTKGRATMIFENGEVRRIWLDGRQHPPADELESTMEGDSIGHWQGPTLVVDTIGLAPKAEIFMGNGINVTHNTHVVERIGLKDASTLQIETTIIDPAIFTVPFRNLMLYQKIPGSFEVGCAANNRDDGVNPVDLSLPR